jgi:putative hydrolase of the HAD superfamily
MYSQAPNKTGVKAVVFDLDDTLYPEQQYIMSGFSAVARYVHNIFGKHLLEDLVAVYQAGERTNVFRHALMRHFSKVDENIVRNVAHVYLAHRPRIELYEDSRLALAMLCKRRIPTALITRGHAGVQRRKVEALGLADLLDSITYLDEMLDVSEPGQICADAFSITALEFNVATTNLLYVGSQPHLDFHITRKLGIATVQVRRPALKPSVTPLPTPDHAPGWTIESLDRLFEIWHHFEPQSAVRKTVS